MIYHFDIQQKSVEWHNMRAGKITASVMEKLFASAGRGDGVWSMGALNEFNRIVGERVSGMASMNEIHSAALNRGNELETLARRLYQVRTFTKVREVGFVESDCHTYGCSPDGLIGDDGMIEIKGYSRIDEHVKAVRGANNKHKIQIQFQLFVTGRKWCDYVSYYPEAGKGVQISIVRHYPDHDLFKQFEYKLKKAEAKIIELTKEYKESKMAS